MNHMPKLIPLKITPPDYATLYRNLQVTSANREKGLKSENTRLKNEIIKLKEIMSRKNRPLEAIDKLNYRDVISGTSLVKVSNTIVRSNSTKRGTEITIGIENSTMDEIMKGDSIAVLVVVNWKEYQKLTQ